MPVDFDNPALDLEDDRTKEFVQGLSVDPTQAGQQTAEPNESTADAASQPSDDSQAGSSPVSNEVRQEAMAFGFTEDDLQSLGSDEAVQAAMRVYDRQMAQSYLNSLGWNGQQADQSQWQGQQTSAQEQQQAQAQQIPLDELPEEVRGPFKALLDRVESQTQENQQLKEQIASFQQSFQQRETQTLLTQFNQALDEIAPDFYGKTGRTDAGQSAYRQEALNTFAALYQQSQAQGVPADVRTLAKRAANATHADRLRTRQNQQQAEKIKERSKKRMGGPAPSRAGKLGVSDKVGKGQSSLRSKDDPELMTKLEEIWERPS